MNKSLPGLRIKEFPKLTNLIQAIKSLAADLTHVNRHRHIRVKPGTQISNTLDRLDSRITDRDGCKRKSGRDGRRDAILSQNFRLTEAAACVIHELFECIIYTMRHFCVSCKWELVHSAKSR